VKRVAAENLMRSSGTLRCFIITAVLAAGASAASAQTWPARAIGVISPFAAGSANEIVARIVLDQVSRQIGQSIIVENRPGGGGTLGAAMVANAAPDGYTLLLHASSLSAQVVLHKALPYDPVRDFAPITGFAISPSVLVVAPSKNFRSVADLVAVAKAQPGVLNYASAGIGSASHMAAERLRVAAGIEAQHIPFRGPVEAFTELMAGRIDFYFLPIAPALPVIAEGKLTALAVSTPKRAAALPDVPTVAEAGYPGAEYLFWGGLFGPAKTPRPIVEKLHRESEKAISLPTVVERYAQLGVEPMSMSIAQFEEFFRNDVAQTVKLARDAGIMPTE
jgi:tripartite-type tricarboxylate transporter receptor subunit TctC